MKRSRLKRHTPINPVNTVRRDARTAKVFGLQAALCRQMPCVSCGAPPPSDPDHLRTRGAGGSDRGNVTALCASHHDERHRLGVEQFELECGPFRVVLLEDGLAVDHGVIDTLGRVADAIERLAYPTQECGCGWDWADTNDEGELVCVEPVCISSRGQ